MSDTSTSNPVYWGWIPHLDSSFSKTVTSKEFVKTLAELMSQHQSGVDVNVRDHVVNGSIPAFDGTVRLAFSGLDGFDYDNGTTFECDISLGPHYKDLIKTSVSVASNGMVCISVDSVQGPLLERLESVDDVRIIVREIYFMLKKLFHIDIFNEPEDLFNSSMSVADDTLSIVRADTYEEALENIYEMFLHKIDHIARLKHNEVSQIIESERMAHGYRFFAEGFIRSCVPKEEMEDKLAAMDLKYRAVKAVKDNSLDRKTVYMQDVISKYTIPVWIVTLVISILAGSLFSDLLSGNLTGFTFVAAAIVVAASFALVIVLVFQYLKIKDERARP